MVMLVPGFSSTVQQTRASRSLANAPTQARVCRALGPLRHTSALQNTRSTHQHQPRGLVVRQGLLQEFLGTSGDSKEAKVPWHQKVCAGSEYWTDLKDRAALEAAILCKDDKFAVIDLYAGWCASCKSAYPALCKVATSDRLRQSITFYKANIDGEGISAFIKENEIKGIPYLLVFSPKVKGKAAAFPASFQKMEAVRHNLELISSNSLTLKYATDKDSSHVFPV